MTPWRENLTAMADLSASIFATCFMVLLIFLTLIQDRDRHRDIPQKEVDVTEALRTVEVSLPTPREMVAMLNLHGTASTGLGLDLFEDRIEMRRQGSAQPELVEPSAIAMELAGALRGDNGTEAVRVYVLSSRHYASVMHSLWVSARHHVEISVPAALRSDDSPNVAWHPAFLALGSRELDAEAFRRQLAALLAGRDDVEMPLSGLAGYRPQTSFRARLSDWISIILALAGSGIALIVMFGIERTRFRELRSHEVAASLDIDGAAH